MARVVDPFEAGTDRARRITPLTRREIFDYLRTDGGPWWGRLDEVDFLARIYDLEELPSYDSRFPTAARDVKIAPMSQSATLIIVAVSVALASSGCNPVLSRSCSATSSTPRRWRRS